MSFNDHSELAGTHAVLSASKSHWLRYTPEKLAETLRSAKAAAHGTRLHEYAKESIELNQKLPRSTKTLNQYVNDAIGYGMTPEVVLFYSYNIYGTADAIKLQKRKSGKDILRIHDLKTGKGKVSFEQLMVYAALYCLEYDIRPGEIEFELRIYQNDEIAIFVPEVIDIAWIMERIKESDELIEQFKKEAF